MANPSPKRWPLTVTINLDLCPRCGEPHGETEYRRFDLGDPQFTHWSYCPATGEPLLVNMARRQVKKPDKFWVRWVGAGRKATQKPDPRYPHGVDVDPGIPDGQPSCKVQLPYPATEVGAWKVECTECKVRIACTAAGRTDDPRSILLPCKK